MRSEFESRYFPNFEVIFSFRATNPSEKSNTAAIIIKKALFLKSPSTDLMIEKRPNIKLVKVRKLAACFLRDDIFIITNH